jgi:type II secretory pathway pseudopilin PulG
MKSPKQIGIVLLLLGLIGLGILPAARPKDPGASMTLVQVDMREVLFAMQQYAAEYNHYPDGNSSEILTALVGNNPGKLQFIVLGQGRTNSRGELTDPWQTPYRIVFDSTNHFTIRSAGKNKVFGDQDDYELSSSGGK